MVEITRCKHGKDLTQAPCYMCQSLWEKKSDEDEFIEFFQKGIDTIAGQRHKIRQLEQRLKHALTQAPMVRCHGCDEAMSTCDSRTRTEHNPYGATLYREIEETQYRCKICGHQIWVAKLEGTIEWKK
jgi:hypothetical protein